ncbi:MAG: hypothetical protein QM765_33630 [Myxococcales bacterium]
MYDPGMSDSKEDLLAQALADHPGLLDPARRIFEYARFLLDDDEKLTKTGALNGEARELLRARILELVDPAGAGGAASSEGSQDAEDESDDAAEEEGA